MFLPAWPGRARCTWTFRLKFLGHCVWDFPCELVSFVYLGPEYWPRSGGGVTKGLTMPGGVTMKTYYFLKVLLSKWGRNTFGGHDSY